MAALTGVGLHKVTLEADLNCPKKVTVMVIHPQPEVGERTTQVAARSMVVLQPAGAAETKEIQSVPVEGFRGRAFSPVYNA